MGVIALVAALLMLIAWASVFVQALIATLEALANREVIDAGCAFVFVLIAAVVLFFLWTVGSA